MPTNPMSSNLESETFREFFENWLVEQNQYLSELISLAKANDADPTTCSNDVDMLIKRVMECYEHYYKVKSHWIDQDALAMLKPTWISSLEDTFLWLGGWRPSIAFHLLYSKSGLQLEGRLPELIHGLSTGDLADLSYEQIMKTDTLQRATIKKEREISEKMAKYQETIADPSMVELAHVASESKRERGESSVECMTRMEEQLTVALGRREDGLKEIVKMADELRLTTLKEIVGILTKSQTVHFFIAAAELHLRIHEWGLQRDCGRRSKEPN
ncbi:protein DOG1-like 4 [Cucurbita moschata]|uniref:Protein DOG1-like 4 n=2 Tax=Cucurbita TaxID=3660 RepID=A0A6J1EB45_CUCMO